MIPKAVPYCTIVRCLLFVPYTVNEGFDPLNGGTAVRLVSDLASSARTVRSPTSNQWNAMKKGTVDRALGNLHVVSVNEAFTVMKLMKVER